MEIIAGNSEGIEEVAAILKRGEICAVPSETVYGLAANALDPVAVEKIFAAKGRPHTDPLIVHISDIGMLHQCAVNLPQCVESLAAAFWPGPLTVIVQKHPRVPDVVTAGLPCVAIRMPGHPVLRELIARCGFPLAAPSANPFGYISPTRVEHVAATLGDKVHWGLDGGSCQHGVESTILNLCDTPPRILRQGPILPEMIRTATGILPQLHHTAVKGNDVPLLAPGTLLRHYSPSTPVVLCDNPDLHESDDPLTALVLWARPVGSTPTNVYWLSETGDAAEAAHNLYSMLHALDSGQYRRIVVQRAPDHGLGHTVNDRLQRAASRS